MPLYIVPESINAIILPIGQAIPHSVITIVFYFSLNHKLENYVMAFIKSGNAQLFIRLPTSIHKKLLLIISKNFIQPPNRFSTQAILKT